jgi:hypothetical protein
MMTAANIHYEIADRTRATTNGGIGAMHLLARKLGLDQAIDASLGLLKIHLPYHESDHVLNIAYNLLAGGTCLEHLELLRSDEAYLDAFWAPDASPTRPRQATSVAASTRPPSSVCRQSSTPHD